jgi:hypothetical protein
MRIFSLLIVSAALALAQEVTDVQTQDLTSSGRFLGDSVANLYRNTKVTIVNQTPRGMSANMGTDIIDPGYFVARSIAVNNQSSIEGYNSFASSDVTIQANYLDAFGLQVIDQVRIEAGNPKIGYPWVAVGGFRHSFKEGETWDVDTGAHKFRVLRKKDLTTSKDIWVTILQ